MKAHYWMWKDHAISQSIQVVDAAIKSFGNCTAVIFNAIHTQTTSGNMRI